MTTQVAAVKHKSERSVARLLGQDVDASGNVTGQPIEVRLAYIFAHEKRTKSAGGAPVKNPHYSVVVMAPQITNDPATCPNYRKLYEHVTEASRKAGWGDFPQGGKFPIQNGNVPFPHKPQPGQAPLSPEQLAKRNKWREGYWIVEATNYNDGGVRVAIAQNGTFAEIPARVVDNHQLYKSGDYGFVRLHAWSFHNETFGLNFGFEGLLFTRSGEAIGSSGPKSAAQMFGGVTIPTAPAPQPPMLSVPPMIPGAPPTAQPSYVMPQPQAYAPPGPPMAPTAPQAYAPPGAPALPAFPGAPR